MADYNLGSVTNIIDVAKMHNGKDILPIVELLHKKNGLFRTAHMEEANELTSHVYTKEVALPGGTFRGVNQGTTAGNYQVGQEVEALGRLEGRSEIDEYLLDLQRDPMTFRLNHDMGHLEGYTQDVVSAFLYADPADNINKPRGMAIRLNDLSQANVHNGGASSNCTSILLAQWGPKKLSMLYPSGRGAEVIKQEDMKRIFIVTNATTGEGLFKWVTRFYSNFGFCLYDDRAVQRIANLGTNGVNEVDLDMLFWAMDSLPDPDDTTGACIYANRMGKYQIEKALRNRPNLVSYTVDQYGRQVTNIRGIPLVMLEGISTTEAAVA